ncbi:hypothetical protein ES703_42467 [subsurface metagenome]
MSSPATASFCFAHFSDRGRFRFYIWTAKILTRAGHRFFLQPFFIGDTVTFTEHMSRVEYLTAQTLIHVQEENYQKAREDLDNIHVHTTAAQKQISDLEFSKAQGDNSSDQFIGGP